MPLGLKVKSKGKKTSDDGDSDSGSGGKKVAKGPYGKPLGDNDVGFALNGPPREPEEGKKSGRGAYVTIFPSKYSDDYNVNIVSHPKGPNDNYRQFATSVSPDDFDVKDGVVTIKLRPIRVYVGEEGADALEEWAKEHSPGAEADDSGE